MPLFLSTHFYLKQLKWPAPAAARKEAATATVVARVGREADGGAAADSTVCNGKAAEESAAAANVNP